MELTAYALPSLLPRRARSAGGRGPAPTPSQVPWPRSRRASRQRGGRGQSRGRESRVHGRAPGGRRCPVGARGIPPRTPGLLPGPAGFAVDHLIVVGVDDLEVALVGGSRSGRQPKVAVAACGQLGVATST